MLHPGSDARFAATLTATAAALVRPGTVISHESAAILYGIDVLCSPPWPTLSTEAGRAGTRSGITLRIASLPEQELSSWYGVSITTPARTIADIARLSELAGLVSADSALRIRLLTPAQLAQSVVNARGWPGARAAQRVLARANGLSESPLESLTRFRLLAAGLPVPELQVVIPGIGARVDMLYREQNLVIEADGLGKYTSPDTLRAEKRRQVAIERAGYRVIRVMWSQVIGDASEFIADVLR